jgi:uncharacterized protein with PIN domain
MIVIDTSAIIAIVLKEPEGEICLDTIDGYMLVWRVEFAGSPYGPVCA